MPRRSASSAGAEAKGVEPAQADYIFELVAKFAGYGFNKSHAACYAIVAYQTAYLKANHPVEFLAASMTLDLGNTDKLQVFRREAQRLKVAIRPALGQQLGRRFRGEGRRHPLFAGGAEECRAGGGRASVETVRDAAARSRRSAISRGGSIRAFSTSGRSKAWPRPALSTASIRNRAEVLAGVEAILATASRTSSETEAGQVDLFWRAADRPRRCRCRSCRAWTADGAAGARVRGGGFLSLGPSARRLYAAARQARGGELCPFPGESAQGGGGGAAHRHRHLSPGAPLVAQRQPLRLHRLFRSDRSVRGGMLRRHARRLPRPARGRQGAHCSASRPTSTARM